MMSTEDFVYDGSTESLRRVFQLHPQGVRILCPECRNELTVALTVEEANKFKVHPGIYCSVDSKHVMELISLQTVRDEVLGKPR
jgi:hypothetical protein